MTFVILTTDTLHHRYFVNRIARSIRPIVVLERRAASQWRSYLRTLRRERTLAALVENSYLCRSYRGFNRRQDEFERQALFASVPNDFSGAADVLRTDDVNSADFLRQLDLIRPTLVVSFGTGRIGHELLARPGVKVNVHRGVLPAYRGLDSDLWACWLRDFSNIGTCVHLLEPGLDTGPVYEQRRLTLAPGMAAHHLRYHTTVLAAEIVERAIGSLRESGDLPTTPQDASLGRYYSYIPPIRRAVAIRRLNKHVRGLERSPGSALRERQSLP